MEYAKYGKVPQDKKTLARDCDPEGWWIGSDGSLVGIVRRYCDDDDDFCEYEDWTEENANLWESFIVDCYSPDTVEFNWNDFEWIQAPDGTWEDLESMVDEDIVGAVPEELWEECEACVDTEDCELLRSIVVRSMQGHD